MRPSNRAGVRILPSSAKIRFFHEAAESVSLKEQSLRPRRNMPETKTYAKYFSTTIAEIPIQITGLVPQSRIFPIFVILITVLTG